MPQCLPCELCPRFLLFEISQWGAIRKDSSTDILLGQVPTKLSKVNHVIQNEQNSSAVRPIKRY